MLTEIEVSDRYDIASELCVQEYAQEDMKQFRFRNFHTDGLILIDVQTVFSQLLHAQLSFEGHVIAIVFHLSGSCRMTSTSRGSKIKEKSGDSECHNILVVQGDTLDLLFEPGMLVDSFIVLLSREFCLRVMPQEYDKYNNLLYAVEKGTDATLFSSFLDFILILHCFRGNDCHEPQVTLNFENEILTVLTNGIFFVVE